MKSAQYSSSAVLSYPSIAKSRGTIRRHYLAWRLQQHIPERCDDPRCRYHNDPLTWNRSPLPLILDHISGNTKDNTPQNLRLLCPNCESQLETRGGHNVGRIHNEPAGGYQVKHRNGRVDAHAFPGGVKMTASVASVRAHVTADEDDA